MSTDSKIKYHLPKGYSLPQTLLNSISFVKNPIKFIEKSMGKFNETYTARLPQNRTLIITQNADFVEYVLRENQKNYQKSELSTDRAATFLGTGLLFSNGEEWLKQRRLIQPGFHHQKINGLYEIVIKSIKDFLANFPSAQETDVYPLMQKLAFNIVVNSLFDIKISEEIMQELSDIFSELQDFIIKEIHQPFRKLFYPLNGQESKAFKKTARLREIIRTIIAERKASNTTFNDLLDMLLAARYEDTGLPMEDEKIIDEILILIFAGHETTANTLSWLLYLIANHKKILQKAIEEINNITVTDSPKNNYLQALINEAMRLYPAAWMTERVALNDDQFGEYSYPKGTIIIPFFFGMHRNKNYWKEETSFSPERFLNEKFELRKMKNFFPFGAGPRMCIGNNFAMAEMAFFLHLFLSNFSISPVKQQPTFKALITLRPSAVLLHIKKL